MPSDHDFFPGLAAARWVEHLDAEQLRALSEIRVALARAEARYVAPEQTRGSISDYVEMSLEIGHAADPAVQIELTFGDGYLALFWPGGRAFGGCDWKPELGAVVEALLAGRNLQTVYRRGGRVVTVVTETWDDHGVRTRHVRRRWVPAILLRPFVRRASRRSLSFDRAPAFRFER